uniref:Reverse transcriptase domain-containing protein n=1 Tax=Tanacetum cinerariifolium TaxID=118510 RepID=A0A699H8U6_TANCI|nr:hypothetical protein [Tanacetum cinerariifolium]
MSEEVFQAKENLMKSIQTFLEKFNHMSFGEIPKIINEELAEYINSPSWNRPTFYSNDEEHSVQYKEYLENSSNAIAASNFNQEKENLPQDSDIQTESDEVIESSAKNLVPIPSEYEVTSDDESECDVSVYEDSSTFYVLEDHSEMLFDSNNDDISNDDDAFEDIDINHLIADIESLNNNPTPDHVLKSSALIPIFEESDNSLSDNSLPEFETFSDHTEETRRGNTTTHANNSFLEYDSFCFEIELDRGRLTSVVMKDISDDSSNDPLLEEIDLFLASDNSIPSGIENIDYDSEGDIHFHEELLVHDSISFPENESSNFDHHDDPSYPRPPSEPPDVEFFFKFEPNSGEVILAMMKNIDELNEDECFDPGGEIDDFTNVEDDDYFPFIFIIRIFLPYLTYPEVSPLLLSAGSEDTIFDPGISV